MPNHDLEHSETLRRKRRAFQARQYESKSFAAIGDELGVSANTAQSWVREMSVIMMPLEEEEELRQTEVLRLDKDEYDARQAEQWLINEGMRRDVAGLSNVDVMEALRRWKQTILDIRKQRALLLGLNKPVKVHHKHVIRDEFDEEIEDLVSQLAGGGTILTKPDDLVEESDDATSSRKP